MIELWDASGLRGDAAWSHWDFQGRADRSMNKHVFLALQGCACVVTWLVFPALALAIGLGHADACIGVPNRRVWLSTAFVESTRRIMSLWTASCGVAIAGFLARFVQQSNWYNSRCFVGAPWGRPLSYCSFQILPAVASLLGFVCLAHIGLWLYFKKAPRGARELGSVGSEEPNNLSTEMRDSLNQEQQQQEDDSEEHWVCGVFYRNPSDPRFLVPKRLGLGWTFNFAFGRAWLLTFALLASSLVVVAAVGAPLLWQGKSTGTGGSFEPIPLVSKHSPIQTLTS
eukprot:CAMPEP_0171076800 /NCGR_PEP_ID=MMETSP0766_2-20121228/13646_1 /TAXON_ID=439317 /ORGANISM="Gambierdiscus australes, Strain CAWD 149" /LENGTH=283 /DNA_ID=CAMNT_0011533809 /DNA_START=121 /DNA_END=972 /DNA_ORIENTATION=-